MLVVTTEMRLIEIEKISIEVISKVCSNDDDDDDDNDDDDDDNDDDDKR